jgi:hypothetical protein
MPSVRLTRRVCSWVLAASAVTAVLVYQILFDNGMSASIPLAKIASIVPPPPISDTPSPEPSLNAASSLLPPFLMVGSRITYEHDST